MARPRSDIAILLIAVIGIALALYATTLHFKSSGDSICDISETFSCDKVNKSPWATFFGIPVAILGAISYLAVFLIILKKRAIMRALSFTSKDFAQYFLLLTVVMFGFQAYLTFVEIFWIHAYCVVCLGSQLCTLVLLLIAGKEYLSKS